MPPGAEGPALSAMAPHHPPDFFAEFIIDPSAVIDKGRGYEAADGTSKMPTFSEDITVKELIDLVAYLVNLKPQAANPAARAGPSRLQRPRAALAPGAGARPPGTRR